MNKLVAETERLTGVLLRDTGSIPTRDKNWYDLQLVALSLAPNTGIGQAGPTLQELLLVWGFEFMTLRLNYYHTRVNH